MYPSPLNLLPCPRTGVCGGIEIMNYYLLYWLIKFIALNFVYYLCKNSYKSADYPYNGLKTYHEANDHRRPCQFDREK